MTEQARALEAWSNRIVGQGAKPANQFLAHELNARRHPAKQREALRGSLNDLGFVAPVIESLRSGKVLDGHARIEEALSRDEEMLVPFVQVELTEDEEAKMLAVFDPITGLAEYDKEALDSLLRDVTTGEPALQQMLSDLAKSNGLYSGNDSASPGTDDAEPETSRAEELKTKWKVERGQLWHVGDHRLLCGDSTKAEDVGRLLYGIEISLLATDPPYGANYVDKARDLHAKGYLHSKAAMEIEIENDELSGPALIDFLKSSIGNALDYAANKCALYLWYTSGRQREVIRALDDLEIFIHQNVYWLKPGFVIGRCNYHHQIEPAIHGWPQGKRPEFLGERNQSNVWRVERENDKIHPTQKPLELFTKPMVNHTHAGQIVYEPFAGSGTQLVAAQNCGRKCYAVEHEPLYVAIILERMKTAFPALEIRPAD